MAVSSPFAYPCRPPAKAVRLGLSSRKTPSQGLVRYWLLVARRATGGGDSARSTDGAPRYLGALDVGRAGPPHRRTSGVSPVPGVHVPWVTWLPRGPTHGHRSPRPYHLPGQLFVLPAWGGFLEGG